MGRASKGDRTAVLLRLPPDLIARIDANRGVLNRTAWFEQAALAALDPINVYRHPELDARPHICTPGTLRGTSFRDGAKVRTYNCAGPDCELEVTL